MFLIADLNDKARNTFYVLYFIVNLILQFLLLMSGLNGIFGWFSFMIEEIIASNYILNFEGLLLQQLGSIYFKHFKMYHISQIGLKTFLILTD